MIRIFRTESTHPNFIQLVKLLDEDPAIRDGNDHSFYAQFNKIDKIKHTLVAYENTTPVACGAMKEFNSETIELKRMYTLPDFRGKGIASMIVAELEKWAAEVGYKKCVLETGKKQPQAIQLYKKLGYKSIPNYGQYHRIENSVCFEKNIFRF